MKDWQQRVTVEHGQLGFKMSRLSNFIDSDKYPKLALIEQQALSDQLDAMARYEAILTGRITRFDS